MKNSNRSSSTNRFQFIIGLGVLFCIAIYFHSSNNNNDDNDDEVILKVDKWVYDKQSINGKKLFFIKVKKYIFIFLI
jgi:hypothetical protein